MNGPLFYRTFVAHMKRALPLWMAAVVPATLAGHSLAYALNRQTVTDAHHAWMQPAWEASLAVLAAVCALLLGGSLVRAGVLMHTAAERSFALLWPRLAIAQLAIFALVEHAEGARVSVLACAVQLVVAALAAALLALFASLLVRCLRGAQEASRYLERQQLNVQSFVSRRPSAVAYALAVRTGTARFQRPPPFA